MKVLGTIIGIILIFILGLVSILSLWVTDYDKKDREERDDEK